MKFSSASKIQTTDNQLQKLRIYVGRACFMQQQKYPDEKRKATASDLSTTPNDAHYDEQKKTTFLLK